MKKATATEIQHHSLSAIKHLTQILSLKEELSDQTDQTIKKGVGLSLGTIQTEILDKIYSHYPELDDLIDRTNETIS